MTNKLAFIIEDDFDGSMVFAKAVEANGLEPEQIMTGNRALERIAESVPTLVVLDLHLPVVPGPDILKKIRADGRLSDTLVVVVTADPRMADVIREEADLVLLKPTTFSQVRDLVGRLLALRERNVRAAAAHPEPAAPALAPIPAELAILPVHTLAEPAAAPAPAPAPIAEAAPAEPAVMPAPAAAPPAEAVPTSPANGDGAASAAQAAPEKPKKAARKSADGVKKPSAAPAEASAETPAAAPQAAEKSADPNSGS